MDYRFKRIFLIVLDSMGIGSMADSEKFGDVGVDTLGHISDTVEEIEKALCITLQPFVRIAKSKDIKRQTGALSLESHATIIAVKPTPPAIPESRV